MNPGSTTKDTGPEQDRNLRVIGIGASAGGLAAIEAFLSRTPEKSGMAFVIISHTDPRHVSLLPEILQRKSPIPVHLIQADTEPEPDNVYLPPSNKDLLMERTCFQLVERMKKNGLHMPIDRFLRSLALNCGNRAGCVILSGTGTDGTEGLRFIKEKAGVTFCQKPDSALHGGMPQSAIDTGVVDFVLAPEEIPDKLIQYFEHSPNNSPEEKWGEQTGDLQKILTFLVDRTGHDFSLYKKNSLIRRIERRMNVTVSSDGSDYLKYLNRHPKEAEILFEDLLIGVTNFFRDPEAFALLRKEALPYLIRNSDQSVPFRVWVAGCSTGEEAYSTAITVQESLEETRSQRKMQIFATDLDAKAIEKARHGVYIQNIAADVNRERLERFFVKEENHYRVKTSLRESIIFAVQNVLSDPPYSGIDLLVCRNLLIYLEAKAQHKLLPLFHYVLRGEGILFLGSSDSVGRFEDLFEPVKKKFNIYRKRKDGDRARSMADLPAITMKLQSKQPLADREGVDRETDIRKEAEKILVKQYTPACVVVDRKGKILHVHGRIGKYLEDPEGKPTNNITEKAREGIRFALSSALRKADTSGEEIRHERLRININGDSLMINLQVSPFPESSRLKNVFMVIFEDLGGISVEKVKEGESPSTDDHDSGNIELEHELKRVRLEYQGSLEELQISNEELRSANEEAHSSNEELQSINEELQSSHEELQSLNEELSTVNSELNRKTEELSRSYESISQVLDNTRIAILFLSRELDIIRFTSEAARLFNLIDSDVGRPIGHISHNLEYENLEEKIWNVLNDLTAFEDEVRTEDRHWYRMKIMLFLNDQAIEGIVVTFINIDAEKKAMKELLRIQHPYRTPAEGE